MNLITINDRILFVNDEQGWFLSSTGNYRRIVGRKGTGKTVALLLDALKFTFEARDRKPVVAFVVPFEPKQPFKIHPYHEFQRFADFFGFRTRCEFSPFASYGLIADGAQFAKVYFLADCLIRQATFTAMGKLDAIYLDSLDEFSWSSQAEVYKLAGQHAAKVAYSVASNEVVLKGSGK